MSAAAIEDRPISPLRLGLIRFAANKTALGSAVVILAFIVVALAAPLIAPHDPAEADLFRRLQPPAWAEGGEWGFLLGCDGLGRDILSRLIWGARVSLLVAGLVIAIAAAIGTMAGLAAGRLDAFASALRHLALPAITLGLPTAALLARVVRSSMAATVTTGISAFFSACRSSTRAREMPLASANST